MTAPYPTPLNKAKSLPFGKKAVVAPPGPRGPIGTPGGTSRGGQAGIVAKKAVKTTRPTNIPKSNGRKLAGAQGNPNDIPSVPSAAPVDTSGMNIEDAALTGDYNTNIDINQNQKLKGLAGTVQLPNAGNYAKSMANMQYGPQIQATAGRIKGLIAALPGAMESLNAAFANVNTQRQITPATPTSGAGVANLFGGAGGVGAAGAAAVAANQAVQSNATQANQIGQLGDEGAAAGRRQADWATRIQLLNNMAVNQGRTELAGELGQKGAAQKAYFDQGLKMRGDMISQAIGNQGALQNQKIAAALASGQIEGMKLTNEQKALLVQQMGISNQFLPDQLATGLQGQKQSILTSQLTNNINSATAKAQLKALNSKTTGGVNSMSDALKAGGASAIAGLILPPGAYGTDSTSGRPKVFGDLNTYFNKGVEAIMTNLPGSSRKNVKQYVANELQKVASATNQWVYKGGRFQKVTQPKAKK